MEFLRVGLAVRICLEDKISPIFDGVIVSVKQSRTMSAVRLGKRCEKRACLGAITQDLVGIVFTAIDVDKYSKLSVLCHLLSGWCVLFFVRPLIANASVNAFYLILAGGISYSLGAILYWLGKKVKYMHSIFHVFVLAGSVLQWLAIYLYMI